MSVQQMDEAGIEVLPGHSVTADFDLHAVRSAPSKRPNQLRPQVAGSEKMLKSHRRRHAPFSVTEQLLLELRHENESLRRINRQLTRTLDEVSRQRSESLRLAHQDHLTGLPNRLALLGQLQQRIAKAFLEQRRLALLFIDLDGFKEVNDRHGHLTGDKLLIAVGGRITGCIRADDLACRYGGDEFIVMLQDISSPDSLTRISTKISECISEQFSIAGEQLRITASVGISVYPDDGTHCDTLLSRADASMYSTKPLRTIHSHIP